jgi:hypothetical protein
MSKIVEADEFQIGGRNVPRKASEAARLGDSYLRIAVSDRNRPALSLTQAGATSPGPTLTVL